MPTPSFVCKTGVKNDELLDGIARKKHNPVNREIQLCRKIRLVDQFLSKRRALKIAKNTQ